MTDPIEQPEDQPLPDQPEEPLGGSVPRAAMAAGEVALGYSAAAVRSGLTAVIGIGRGAVELTGQIVDRTPIGAAAASTADALEPAAARSRARRRQSSAELRAVVESVVEQVVNQVVERLDVDGIVRTVDVDDIVQRVDIDGIIKRVDVNGIVERVDVEEVVSRVDIDAIVGRTEIGNIIVQSTGGVATEALDAVRSQGVSLDGLVVGITDRVLRRRSDPRPEAPPLLEAAEPLELEEAGAGDDSDGAAVDASTP